METAIRYDNTVITRKKRDQNLTVSTRRSFLKLLLGCVEATAAAACVAPSKEQSMPEQRYAIALAVQSALPRVKLHPLSMNGDPIQTTFERSLVIPRISFTFNDGTRRTVFMVLDKRSLNAQSGDDPYPTPHLIAEPKIWKLIEETGTYVNLRYTRGYHSITTQEYLECLETCTHVEALGWNQQFVRQYSALLTHFKETGNLTTKNPQDTFDSDGNAVIDYSNLLFYLSDSRILTPDDFMLTEQVFNNVTIQRDRDWICTNTDPINPQFVLLASEPESNS